MEIWIAYHSNVTGDTENFACPNWEAAKSKSVQIIENEILHCDVKTAAEILVALETEDWRDAVVMYNKCNFRKNDIRFYSKTPYKDL